MLSLLEISDLPFPCKPWGSERSSETREFVVGPRGVSLAPLKPKLVPALPLLHYSRLTQVATTFPLPERIGDAAALQAKE
jgi:hypothetical protein